MRRIIVINFILNAALVAVVVIGLANAGWIGPGRGVTPSPPEEPAARVDPKGEELSVEQIVERAAQATVAIMVNQQVPKFEQFYDNFFGFQIPRLRPEGSEEQQVGAGSGFLVSATGYIVTNRHVVADDQAKYQVVVGDNENKIYDAQVVARDPQLDVAVLRIRGPAFPHLSFGNSDLLRPGQSVIAIGNPLGELPNSVSVGVISGLSRSIVAGDQLGQSEVLEEVIQTDAAINPGNSGGPLLNRRGEVIGVNVAVARGSENIGFALPVNLVKGVVDQVVKTGSIARAYLGIRYIQMTPTLKEKNNLPVAYGVLVTRGATREELAVIPGSPADKAGIVENDIILEIDGTRLDGKRSLASLIRAKAVGETVRLRVFHRGTEKSVTLTLERLRE